MVDSNINERTLEVCKKVMKNGNNERKKGEAEEQPITECVVLCRKVGEDLYEIDKGIAKIRGRRGAEASDQFMVLDATKMMFIVE